jgi:hypothetical protein
MYAGMYTHAFEDQHEDEAVLPIGTATIPQQFKRYVNHFKCSVDA